MNRNPFYLLAFFSFFLLGVTVHAQDKTSPEITAEHAIAQAKQHARQKEIYLEGKYIKKVEYVVNLQNPDDRPYWSVYWINRKVTKGGGVELRLYGDGSIEEKYYK